jgi:hypothetical protein
LEDPEQDLEVPFRDQFYETPFRPKNNFEVFSTQKKTDGN